MRRKEIMETAGRAFDALMARTAEGPLKVGKLALIEGVPFQVGVAFPDEFFSDRQEAYLRPPPWPSDCAAKDESQNEQ